MLGKVLLGPALVGCLFGVGCAGPQTTVHAEVPSASTPSRGITVSGFGKASGQPNVARASVGVEVRAETAEKAIADANARMGQVIAALKQVGIAAKDLRTTNVSLYFEQKPEPPRPYEEVAMAPAPTVAPAATPKAGVKATKAGAPTAAPAVAPTPTPKVPEGFYRASNMLEVTIRNLDQSGQVLTAATSAGANQMYGIQFEIEEPSALEAEARQKAFADARMRAQGLAQLAGARLGPAISITEQTGGSMPMHAPMMMKSEAAQVPMERGELNVTTSVQVVFGFAD